MSSQESAEQVSQAQMESAVLSFEELQIDDMCSDEELDMGFSDDEANSSKTLEQQLEELKTQLSAKDEELKHVKSLKDDLSKKFINLSHNYVSRFNEPADTNTPNPRRDADIQALKSEIEAKKSEIATQKGVISERNMKVLELELEVKRLLQKSHMWIKAAKLDDYKAAYEGKILVDFYLLKEGYISRAQFGHKFFELYNFDIEAMMNNPKLVIVITKHLKVEEIFNFRGSMARIDSFTDNSCCPGTDEVFTATYNKFLDLIRKLQGEGRLETLGDQPEIGEWHKSLKAIFNFIIPALH